MGSDENEIFNRQMQLLYNNAIAWNKVNLDVVYHRTSTEVGEEEEENKDDMTLHASIHRVRSHSGVDYQWSVVGTGLPDRQVFSLVGVELLQRLDKLIPRTTHECFVEALGRQYFRVEENNCLHAAQVAHHFSIFCDTMRVCEASEHDMGNSQHLTAA
eukprot:GHVH01011315.1.p2 GENE.GHVH01011315.1~~GHVH01011315.1.p2  ORF type:complete len:158 (-),score=19.99 GHVH01011315.1:816-1289(-)